MTKNKKYPSTFYEWVVGTTIESALGPVPKKKKKPRRRGVLRVELSTDDESGEDTVKITYPRTQPNGDLPRREVKKVRFQQQVPLKSALKKRVQIVEPGSESEEASSASDSATEGSSSEATASAQSSTESPGTSSEGSTDVESTSEEGESTDSDYEPPPPKRKSRESDGARRKLRQRRASLRKSRLAETSSDSESQDDSGSETNSSTKVKNRKLRKRVTKKEEPVPESDTETSGSSPESSESEREAKKKKKARKEKARSRRAKKASKSKKSSDESEEEDNEREKKKRSAKEEDAPKTAKQANADRSDKRNYPEANPLPHPRRPNYVAPVRAEVVQTERVIETPEDPPPNAFYDAEHNIIRVYQGPVYGGNPTRSLYPKRDSTKRPLPVGMPHPTQNPYYYGFNSLPPKKPEAGEFSNVPITQGMPVNAWHAAYPPSGMGYDHFNPALANLGAFNSRGAYHDSAELNAQKNALAKAGSGHNAGQASEKARQKKKVSFAKGPELTSYQNNNNRTSVFADWGKRISPPGSQQDAKEPEPNGGSNNGRTSWYHGNTDGAQSQAGSPQQTNPEPDNWSQNNENNAQDGNGGWDATAPEASGGADGAPDAWDAGASGNDAWGSSEPPQEATFGNDDNNNSGWDGNNENEDNNVAPQGSAMPGSFPSTWGDTAAAADTNGMVDEGGWGESQAEPTSAAKW
ncbi:unnamed protein product [Clonostachys solani]|uniref:Uncharacterized protein n=1 Tax=Clonostachys solani TaxID=160281 RepID=A0A9N9W5A5_9HYPO|nr:unnamed protein product [Clonostachys solani]